ncbi:MAG: hypothetical protein PHD97_11130 [Bacteroidales bacterium]|nr:hypothetical protein [Bacteroidales bacterium]
MTLEGMHFYEVILLILGGLLFISCLIIFILKSVKSTIPYKLISFFIVSIICIGYPSIQKIQFENGKAIIEKKADEIISKPVAEVNSKQKEEFNKEVKEIENSDRTITDPNLINKITEAKLKMGDTVGGKAFIDKAVGQNPDLIKEAGIKTQIDNIRKSKRPVRK